MLILGGYARGFLSDGVVLDTRDLSIIKVVGVESGFACYSQAQVSRTGQVVSLVKYADDVLRLVEYSFKRNRVGVVADLGRWKRKKEET